MAHYDWATLYEKLESCTDCGLCKGRTNVVIGVGNPQSKIMLIGEGPGRDEDIQGYPFVGAAGQLLDKMLAAISLDRTKVYIANIVKCRPPQNRTPLEDEAMACLPYLRAQVALIQPQIIVCLGKTAAMYVIDREIRITRDRGIWRMKKGIWMLPTFHPAALLRDESKKRPVWEDLKKVRDKLQELEANEPNA